MSSSFSSFLRAAVLGATMLLAGLSAAQAVESASASGARPNIVFILADDLGWGDVGCFGQTKIKTPAIDRLATQGTRFTQCYAGASVCGPSRSVLMTGQHMGHTRMRGNNAFAGGIVRGKVRRMSLTENDITVADVLQQAGYHTGLVGKWHLEGFNPKAGPMDHGFQEFYGWLITEPGTHDPAYYQPRCVVNRTVIDIPGNQNGKRGTYETDLYAKYATDFIRRNGTDPTKPFFLYFTPSAPHDPLVAPPTLEPYTNETWDEPMKIYAAMIAHLDSAVGEVTKVLEEMKIADNTIIIFTSDNGPRSIPTPELTRVAEFFDSNGPYTGYKRDMYEGGIREPTVIRWPGHVPVGATNQTPWYFADFFPTALDLAGAKPQGGLDGVSILPVLLGKAKEAEPRFFYWEFYERGFEQAAQWGKWKAVRHAIDGPIELYDLEDDRAERHNLAEQHADIVARFAAYLKAQHVDSPEFPIDHPVPKKSTEGSS